MTYTINSANQVVYMAASWVELKVLLNLCHSALGQLFQAQAARDVTREQFSSCVTVLITDVVRFPEKGFYVFIYDPVIRPIYEALLKSFDTKNRIIETEEESRPSGNEVQNATRRVDDATVAIRSELQNMITVLTNGGATFNRSSFENIVPWTDVASTSK
ncbi:coat protein [Hoya necrotic spot virus]|nr:putative coat protein [Hoya tobamovirus 2]QOC69617.1 coat protein [Hoya necrotic spot virus]WPT07544.1 coat protein [Hoya tobamovirus 2]